jgi:hypothetical protein
MKVQGQVIAAKNVAMRKTKVSWSNEDNERLKALVAAGGTAIRAAGVFNRSTAAVKTRARNLGTPFPPIRVARKKWEPERRPKNVLPPY